MNELLGEQKVVSVDPRRFVVKAEGQGSLIATRCEMCHVVVFGTHGACLACGSAKVHSTSIAQRGRVLSYTTVYRPSKDWWGSVPYVLAEVETDDGVVVVAGMVEISSLQVEAGMRVVLRCVLVEQPSEPIRVGVYQWSPQVESEIGG